MTHNRDYLLLNHTVNSHQTRASFAFINISESDNNNKIQFFPNFGINEGVIDIDTKRPRNIDLKDNLGKTIELSSFDNYNEYLITKKEEIEKISSCVGEIIILYHDKKIKDQVLYYSGTFSLLDIHKNNYIYGLSVFHLINSYCSNEYDKFAFIHFNESSINNFKVIFDKTNNILIKKKENLNEFKINEEFIKQAGLYGIDLIQVDIDQDFLYLRKKFLQKNKNSFILLDPEYKLQPIPSLDFLIFRLDDKLISKQNIFPCKIPESYPNKTNEEVLFLLGYQNIYDYIMNSSNEYKLSQLAFNLPLSYLVNASKSVGIGKISKLTDGIFTFLATTTQGSSGSLILNSKCEAIGISFGNYLDIEETGISKEDQNQDMFDIVSDLENKKNLKVFKNSNLGLSIFHPLLQLFFKYLDNIQTIYEDEFDVGIYDENFRNISEFENIILSFNYQNDRKSEIIGNKTRRKTKSDPYNDKYLLRKSGKIKKWKYIQ